MNKGTLVLIDNYDSFTYNLVQYLEQLGFVRGKKLQIIRNDHITSSALIASDPLAILLSPGPCTPQQAGIGLELVAAAWGKIPMFGVCLGLQTIAQAMGARIVRNPAPMHGKSSIIRHDGKGVFAELPETISMGRYHSLIVADGTLPEVIQVTARVDQSPHEIMAIRGDVQPVVEAVQFHPESILSEYGYKILANFLELALPGTHIDTADLDHMTLKIQTGATGKIR